MKKFYKQYEGICSGIELVTIDNDIVVFESLHTISKKVWKTKEKNLYRDLGWKDEKGYINWLKELDYKELKEYIDNLTWINPNNKKVYKQYEFNI